MKKSFLLFFISLCFLSNTFGQTNPTPQTLPYSQDFSSLAYTSTTYPDGWQGWQLGTTLTTYRTNVPASNMNLIASGNAGTNSGNVWNYNGKIGVLMTGSSNGTLCLALNTTGATNIVVQYDIMTIRNPYDGSTNTKYIAVELQYRIGTTGSFTSVNSACYTNNSTKQITAVTTPQNEQYIVVTLPAVCENQSVVQLRWVGRDVSGAGSRPSFAIDNIDIRSGGLGTNYYSAATGNLNDVNNWWSNPDGSTGNHPINFTSNNQIFNIVNNPNPSISANWTVSGDGSKIVVGDGINFVIPSSSTVIGIIDVAANGKLKIINTVLPTFGSISSASTIEYGQTVNLNGASYPTYNCDLIFSGSGSKIFLGTLNTNGNITCTGTTILNPQYTSSINGNVSLSGTGNNFTITGGNVITIGGDVFVGEGCTIYPGSPGARFVAIGSNKSFTLNGTARVTATTTQDASCFSYQYNGFTNYSFGDNSWISFRSVSTAGGVTQGVDGIADSPYGNVEIAATTNLNNPGTNTYNFNSNIAIKGILAFPRIVGVTNTSLVIDFKNYNIKIGGGIQLNGSNTNGLSGGRTYTMGTSTFEFNGSSAQTIGGTDLPSTFANLIINNPSGVSLTVPVTVNGALTINDGKLTTGANTLTLGPSATLTESAGNYVLGNLQTTRSIGSGASSDFGGAGITLGAAAEDLGNVTLTRVTGSPVTLNSKNSISRIWKLNPANPLTLSRDMTISWLSDDDNGLTLTNLLTWQSTDDFATIDNVAPVGPSGDASTTRSLTVPLNALTSGANTSFTVFQADSPLPVELNTFTSAVKNNAVTLSWSTATEKSNYGFNVERSTDKTNWVKIGFVNGNGNSNSVKNYSFTDKSTNSGKMYYRLKQVDTDGKYEYSKTIEADLGLPKAYELSNNYPNPFNPSTTIRFSLPEKQNVKITVFNTLGQKVAEILNGEMEAGVHEINFNASNLTSGIYIYTMNAGKFTQTKKMMLVK